MVFWKRKVQFLFLHEVERLELNIFIKIIRYYVLHGKFDLKSCFAYVFLHSFHSFENFDVIIKNLESGNANCTFLACSRTLFF